MIGAVVDTDSFYSEVANRFAFEGVKELTASVEMDTDELKVEGYIDDIYSKILSASGSLVGGKIPLDATGKMIGATFFEDASEAFMHIEAGSYVPYIFMDAQSLYDPDGGTADNRLIVYKMKIFGLEVTKGQDGYAEVSFDWKGIFTQNEVDRAIATSKRLASIGRMATASTTLGDKIELLAA
jgi:hypothetical protein